MAINRQTQKLDVNIGGVLYKISSDDDYLESIRRGFEPPMVKLFKTLATGSNTIMDVGANIGCTALLFSELATVVYAFEPSPSTFGFLAHNLEQNKKSNVFAQNIGLGSQPSTSTLTFAPADRSGGFVSDSIKANSDYATEEIKISTLDDFVAEEKIDSIDFIKIDVEGFEAHVIRGGIKTLEKHRPVVVLELNHWTLNAFQRTSVPDFFDSLRAVFPTLLAVDGNYFMDLHNSDESYSIMYEHIVNGHFNNVVAAFDEAQVERLKGQLVHGFSAQVDRSWRARIAQATKILLGRF